MNKTPSPKD